MILNDDSGVLVISNRLQEGGVPPLEQGMVVGQLSLADALIIGNCNNQVGEQLLYISVLKHLAGSASYVTPISSSTFLCK